MTTQQCTPIIREAAHAFATATEADAVVILDLVHLFEISSIPARDAVILLADLEIRRRQLMRNVRLCVQQLQQRTESAPTHKTAPDGSVAT